MTNDPIIKIEQLEKSFGDLHVLKGIDLEVNRGEVVCIIGASGSGKSSWEAPEKRACAASYCPLSLRWCQAFS